MATVTNSYTPPSTKIIVVANYSALPDPTTVSGKFYWAEASQGTSWLPGSLGGTYYGAGMYYSNGVSWSFVNVPYQATQAEVIAGINDDKFVTPNTLAGWWTNIKTLAQTISGIWTFTNGTIYSPLTSPTYAKGLVFYDNSSESLAYYDDISGTTNNINYEQSLRARNNTGSTILNGSVVYITGALGQNPTIALAKSDSFATSEVIGIATHDIPTNTVGKVTTFGLVNDLDTSAFADGAIVYLSSTVAGGLTTTALVSPNFNVVVGIVAHSHVTLGKLFIHPATPISLNTTIGTSNLFGVSEKVVHDALATKQTLWKSGIDGTAVANTLTITPTYSQLIPANTMVTGDVISVDYRATSPGAKTSITNHYLYVNTSNSVSGATQLALSATGATSRTCPLSRKLSVKGATTKLINATTSAQNDLALSAAMTTATIDWTVDQYLIFAIGHTVADQTMFGDFYLISK